MTNLEIKTNIKDDFSIASGANDAFYNDTYIQLVANRAVKWLADLHDWQQTQYGYTRSSVALQEYYNYPEDFKTDRIWKLRFNGINYDRKSFADYLKYQEDNTNSATDKIFTDFQRQFFINPAPTTIATIEIWGHKMPDTMSASGDTHPFAGEADLEEAIVQYGVGICLKKARGSNFALGVAEQEKAVAKANKVWETQKKEQAKYQNKDREMFLHFNILPQNGGERRTQRGSFQSC